VIPSGSRSRSKLYQGQAMLSGNLLSNIQVFHKWFMFRMAHQQEHQTRSSWISLFLVLRRALEAIYDLRSGEK
jgi:hypothetical protein